MAKRKQKKYHPQKMSDEIRRKFELLIGDNRPKPKIDHKYAAISINAIYENDNDLKL